MAELVGRHQLADSSWGTVGPLVRQNNDLFNVLRGEYNVPPLANRLSTRSNAPDAARIVATIDGGGLVIIGTFIHWKIVFGYTSNASGAVTHYKVYNPLENGTTDLAIAPTVMAQGIEETYYVTG